MPTDLPEFFSGSAPLGAADKAAARKAYRKALRKSLLSIGKRLVLHYGVCLAAVSVVAASGFSNPFRAALSVVAVGTLARWFLPVHLAVKPGQPGPVPPGYVEITPEQLTEFFNGMSQQDAAPEGVAKTSPYL